MGKLRLPAMTAGAATNVGPSRIPMVVGLNELHHIHQTVMG